MRMRGRHIAAIAFRRSSAYDINLSAIALKLGIPKDRGLLFRLLSLPDSDQDFDHSTRAADFAQADDLGGGAEESAGMTDKCSND